MRYDLRTKSQQPQEAISEGCYLEKTMSDIVELPNKLKKISRKGKSVGATITHGLFK